MEIDSERADPASPAEAWRRQRREALGRYVEAEAFEAAADEGDLEPSDATFAAELADRSTHEGAHRDALFAGLLAASAARRRGSVRLAIEPGGREALAERLSTLVPALVDEDAAHDAAGALVELAAAEEAGTLIGEPGEYAPLVVENGHLYRHRDRAAEDRVARAVSNRLVDEWTRDFEVAGESPGPDEIRRHLEAIRATTNPTPTVEQLYGVVTAATSPLSALTGGPGTGKTWLITTLLRLLDALGVAPDDIALAAPTGKAADRLGDQLQERIRASVPERGDTLDLTDAGPGGLARMAAALPEPATLHRLLGYSERRRVFRHDEYRPLSHEYVVVDEASMIDLELMDRLVAAMAPEAKLVLVGDAHQLPAVGSGAVFRDLVPSSIETVDRRLEALPEALETRASDEPLAAQSVVLTENFRMNPDRPGGSRILATARAVREGGDELVFSADADDRSADAP
ncbi:MAG: AAA family ATPase, partial [Bradymonadaceae bacterium]